MDGELFRSCSGVAKMFIVGLALCDFALKFRNTVSARKIDFVTAKCNELVFVRVYGDCSLKSESQIVFVIRSALECE